MEAPDLLESVGKGHLIQQDSGETWGLVRAMAGSSSPLLA